MAKQKKYYPYQVPEELYQKLEDTAAKRRKTTGENISWSGVLREIIEGYFNYERGTK